MVFFKMLTELKKWPQLINLGVNHGIFQNADGIKRWPPPPPAGGENFFHLYKMKELNEISIFSKETPPKIGLSIAEGGEIFLTPTAIWVEHFFLIIVLSKSHKNCAKLI